MQQRAPIKVDYWHTATCPAKCGPCGTADVINVTYWYEPKPKPELTPHQEWMREVSRDHARQLRAQQPERLPPQARHRTAYHSAPRRPGFRGARPR